MFYAFDDYLDFEECPSIEAAADKSPVFIFKCWNGTWHNYYNGVNYQNPAFFAEIYKPDGEQILEVGFKGWRLNKMEIIFSGGQFGFSKTKVRFVLVSPDKTETAISLGERFDGVIKAIRLMRQEAYKFESETVKSLKVKLGEIEKSNASSQLIISNFEAKVKTLENQQSAFKSIIESLTKELADAKKELSMFPELQKVIQTIRGE